MICQNDILMSGFEFQYCVLVHVRDREADKFVGFRCSMKNKLPINFKAARSSLVNDQFENR